MQASKLSFTNVIVFAWDTVLRSEGSQTPIFLLTNNTFFQKREGKEKERRKAREKPRRVEP